VGLYPTHGEGSFCTATSAGQYTSTIGDEVDTNPLLTIGSAEQFADELLAAPMPIPAFYQYMGPANTLGVPPMPEVSVPELSYPDLERLPEDTHVVDIRPAAAIAAGYLSGSTGVELTDDFGSWVGWLLPYQAPIVLVAEPGQDVSEAVTQLARIGIDSVRGVVRNLDQAPTSRFELIDVPTFRRRMADRSTQVLDVRMPSERETVRLDGATERFIADLAIEGIPTSLDPDRPVLIVCASGRRAVVAATLLGRAGFQPAVLVGAGVAEVIAAQDAETERATA
jgi:rhodanese-related sulfurtransferase